jgi:hypothetical protein
MITEPVTLATDYALAAVCLWAGARLYTKSESQRSRAFWGAACLALGFSALLGGTHHGFVESIPNFAASWLWKFAVLLIGLASFCMLAGSTIATTSGRVKRGLFIFAVLTLVAYEGWMLRHDQFIWAIYDTGATMAAVLVLHAVRHRIPGSRWILAGVAASAAAALAQASGLDLHEHFNHNDLYHVVQIAAIALFYRGASTIRDWRTRTCAGS